LLPEFSEKRENALSTNERLQQEAQAVLDVIEKPEVAQAMRQDKSQNLQYLKDNYGVRPFFDCWILFVLPASALECLSKSCSV
jgi:hypothetical protein